MITGISIVAGVGVIVFFIFHVLPGDPIDMMMGQRSDIETRRAFEREYGFHESLPTQLLKYFNDLSFISLNNTKELEDNNISYITLLNLSPNNLVFKTPYLRRSFQSNKSVTSIISENFPSTCILAFSSMILAFIIGNILGIITALKHNSFIDHFIITTTVFGISMPSFVAATIVVLVFAIKLHNFTGFNISGGLYEIDPFLGREINLKNLVLPIFTLGIRPLAIVTQMSRNSLLEVLGMDYIRTAKAKGLSQSMVIFKHALPNSLNPVITATSSWMASLLAGTFFIEYIFNFKGLGFVTIQAIFAKDFPVIMGITVFIALLFVVINIFVDILYSVLDPKVKLT